MFYFYKKDLDFKKNAEELNSSLEKIIKAAVYDQVTCMFKQNGNSLNKKSTKSSKKLIKEYSLSQMYH
mgnify:FL=1